MPSSRANSSRTRSSICSASPSLRGNSPASPATSCSEFGVDFALLCESPSSPSCPPPNTEHTSPASSISWPVLPTTAAPFEFLNIFDSEMGAPSLNLDPPLFEENQTYTKPLASPLDSPDLHHRDIAAPNPKRRCLERFESLSIPLDPALTTELDLSHPDFQTLPLPSPILAPSPVIDPAFTNDVESCNQHHTPRQSLGRTTSPQEATLPGVPIHCWLHGCGGRTFSTLSNYRRHCREQSQASGRAECQRCGKTFSRAAARDKHYQQRRCKTMLLDENGVPYWQPIA